MSSVIFVSVRFSVHKFNLKIALLHYDAFTVQMIRTLLHFNPVPYFQHLFSFSPQKLYFEIVTRYFL